MLNDRFLVLQHEGVQHTLSRLRRQWRATDIENKTSIKATGGTYPAVRTRQVLSEWMH